MLCGILAVSAAALVVNETPFADWLMSPLLTADTGGNADVIVVLGAGVTAECEPNTHAIGRVLLGARLWRAARAPALLIAGGRPPGLPCTVAGVMADLAREIGVAGDRLFVEETSRNTRENAERAVPILNALGARRLLVVTDRLHMRRAAGVFASFGYEIERASVPVRMGHRDNISMLDAGMREYMAIAYYRARGWIRQ